MCFPKPKKQAAPAPAAPPPSANTAQVKSYVKSDASDRAQGFTQGVGDVQAGTSDGSGLNVPTKNKRRKGVIGLEV